MANNGADDTLAAVAELLPDAGIEPAGLIRESQWSTVLRVRASAAGWTGPETLVVKRFPGAGAGWKRESAALAAIPGDAPVPQPVALSAEPPLVVMADAGEGPSVADVLLTGTAAEAEAALGEFAGTLAQLHLSTLSVRDFYQEGLTNLPGGPLVPLTAVPELAGRAAADLGTWCSRLDVAVPDGALAALAAIPGRIAADGPSALTLADTCPDNNIRTDSGYVLIDFEEAEWRPLAWDAAYFTVPWPGCWCSFGFPDAVGDRVLNRYRSAVAGCLPYVGTSAFTADVALATTGWALMSTSWYLEKALGDDLPQHDEAGRTPARRPRILHYLSTVRDAGTVPELAELARLLRAELAGRWGEVPLPYAPAFR